MPAYAGNTSELLGQLVTAFNAPKPSSLGETELYVDLINAVLNFQGGASGNAGWTPYPLSPSSEPTSLLFNTSTGALITDFFPVITTAFNGLTPQLDLITGGAPQGVLKSRGANPIPMYVASVEPGSNTGLLVPGTPGNSAAMSYVAAMNTLAQTLSPPSLPAPIYVSASGALDVVITQDGTNQTAVAASATATSVVSLPLNVTSSNFTFTWTGTDPVNGGGGRAPEVFRMTQANYTTQVSLMGAISSAQGALSSEPFSNYATVTTNIMSGLLVITDNGNGAAGNGNIFGPGTNNDVSVSLGFTTPGILGGGAGGNPGSTLGAATLWVNSAAP